MVASVRCQRVELKRGLTFNPDMYQEISTYQLKYSENPPDDKPVTMELLWRLHGRPVQRNHSYLMYCRPLCLLNGHIY